MHVSQVLAGLEADALGYYHPRDTNQVIAVVALCRANGWQVRVRGAGHSIPAAVVSDRWLAQRLGAGDAAAEGVDLVLDRLREVVIDHERGTVTVGAGVRFGVDPLDPHPTEGLCAQLDRQGWALPNLGGVGHQTIVGFLATGSAGGSVQRTIGLRAVELVDGRGELRRIEAGDAAFDAVGVSLGLLGVVVSVTLGIEPRYDVVGTEAVMDQHRAPFSLFADGEAGIQGYLERSEYARVLWWPQRGVERLVLWQVRRAGPGEAVPRVPYEPLPALFGSTLPMQAAATAALVTIGRWRRWVGGALGPRAVRALRTPARRLKGPVYRAFVSGDPAQPQRFSGPWHEVLPMDEGMHERLMTTTFTELWVPLDRAGEALRALHALFEERPALTGRFAIELYAAPASCFWMSPAHGAACLRINVFWLEHDPGDPRELLFPAMWEALRPLGVRYHWGKLLPRDLVQTGEQLREVLVQMGAFAQTRRSFDPDGLFLNAGWAALLGLPGALACPPSPMPGGRVIARYGLPWVGWPLPFVLAPSDASLLEVADLIYDVRATTRAPGHEALALLADERSLRFTPLLRSWRWLTPGWVGPGAVAEEQFVHMAIHQRVVEMTPTRTVCSIDRSSAPLASRMVMVMEASVEADGRTGLRLRVAAEVLPVMRPLKPLLVPLFTRHFQAIVDSLAAEMDRRCSGVA